MSHILEHNLEKKTKKQPVANQKTPHWPIYDSSPSKFYDSSLDHL